MNRRKLTGSMVMLVALGTGAVTAKAASASVPDEETADAALQVVADLINAIPDEDRLLPEVWEQIEVVSEHFGFLLYEDGSVRI